MRKLREIWYTVYPTLLSLCLAGVCFYALSPSEVISLLKAPNASDAFGAVITFASIIIGFVGVLLTAIVSIKRESELIQYFLAKADKKAFSRLISRNILSGIAVALVSAILFFSDELCVILTGRGLTLYIMSVVFCGWIFLLAYFVLSTYKLMQVLLTMLIRSDEKKWNVEDPNKLSESAAASLREKYLKKQL